MEKVLYTCSCSIDVGEKEELKTDLFELYYCPKCVAIRDNNHCVQTHNESYYCPACFENLLSADIISNKACCKKCLLCPDCNSSLHFFLNPKNNVYVMCSFCGWHSLHLDIQTKDVNEFLEQLSQLEEHQQDSQKQDFDELCEILKENVNDKDRKKPKSFFGHLLPRGTFTLKDLEQEQEEKEKRSRPFFSTTEVSQQLAFSDDEDETELMKRQTQFSQKRELVFPQRRKVLTKKSKTCGECGSVLVKPKDIDPHSVQYETRSLAMNVIPKLILLNKTQNKEGNTEYTLQIRNPNSDSIRFFIEKIPDNSQGLELPPACLIFGKGEKEYDFRPKYPEILADSENTSFVGRATNSVTLKLVHNVDTALLPLQMKMQNLKTQQEISFFVFLQSRQQ